MRWTSTVRDMRRIEAACEKWAIPERQARIGCWGKPEATRWVAPAPWNVDPGNCEPRRRRQARLSPRAGSAGSKHSPIAVWCVSFLCVPSLFSSALGLAWHDTRHASAAVACLTLDPTPLAALLEPPRLLAVRLRTTRTLNSPAAPLRPPKKTRPRSAEPPP
jgi:hypothetical protein